MSAMLDLLEIIRVFDLKAMISFDKKEKKRFRGEDQCNNF